MPLATADASRWSLVSDAVTWKEAPPRPAAPSSNSKDGELHAHAVERLMHNSCLARPGHSLTTAIVDGPRQQLVVFDTCQARGYRGTYTQHEPIRGDSSELFDAAATPADLPRCLRHSDVVFLQMAPVFLAWRKGHDQVWLCTFDDSATPTELNAVPADLGSAVSCAAYCADEQRLVVALANSQIVTYDLRRDQLHACSSFAPQLPLMTMTDQGSGSTSSGMDCLAFCRFPQTNNGETNILASLGSSLLIHSWSGSSVGTLELLHNSPITAILPHVPKGVVLTGDSSGCIKITDWDTLAVVHTIAEQAEAISCFLPNLDPSLVFAGSHDATVVLINIDSGDVLQTITSGQPVKRLVSLPHPARFAILCDDKLCFYECSNLFSFVSYLASSVREKGDERGRKGCVCVC
jgi:WD40 repeat protein